VKTILPGVLRLALLLATGTAVSATAPAVIPLIPGLNVVGAASERQGDYESTYTIDGVDADGTLHLDTSAELPDPAGGKAKPVSFNRNVSGNDREHASVGTTNGSDLQAAIGYVCHSADVNLWMDVGVGFALPQVVVTALNEFLSLFHVKEISSSYSKPIASVPIYEGSKAIPPACGKP